MTDPSFVVILGVGVVAGAVWLVIASRSPRILLALFLLAIVALPVWAEVPAMGVAFTPAAIVALLLIPATLSKSGGLNLGRVDVLLAIFLGLALMAVLFAGSPQYAFSIVLSQWVTAYLVGRYLAPAAGLERAGSALAVAGVIAATWGIAEYVSGVHLFENFAGTAPFSWQEIQGRGGAERSEAAFGHSIALGGFITLAAPFVVAAKWRRSTRLLMLGVLTAGAFVTVSRAALISLAIALVLAAWTLRSQQVGKTFRVNLRLLTIGAVAVLIPLALRLFSTAGAELGQSSDYRTRLVEFVLVDLNWIGPADQIRTDTAGNTYYRSFLSIDNEFILAALQFGWLPVLVLVIALAGAPLRLVRRRGTPADVALVASAFVLATVAFITQYTMAFWFVAGLAVAMAQAGLPERDEPEPAPIRSPRPRRMASSGSWSR